MLIKFDAKPVGGTSVAVNEPMLTVTAVILLKYDPLAGPTDAESKVKLPDSEAGEPRAVYSAGPSDPRLVNTVPLKLKDTGAAEAGVIATFVQTSRPTATISFRKPEWICRIVPSLFFMYRLAHGSTEKKPTSS